MPVAEPHKVIIVGGGAGGLELAAKLGRQFGPRQVVLVDKVDTHIWKPSLHEVAAGTLDIHREGLSYFMLARDSGFTFVLGELQALDKDRRSLRLMPVFSALGEEVFPERELHYDSLVLAVGSTSNFFGTPGAAEHAIALDSTDQAERFRLKFLHLLLTGNRLQDTRPGPLLNIGIVGGGATGVELAAELLEASASAAFYGLNQLESGRDISITLLEGGDRILSALPKKMSDAAQTLLLDRGVQVRTSVRIARVEADALYDSQGQCYPVDLCVWAAGIKAPEFLSQLGLRTNAINQIIVDRDLCSSDPDIYALGDCAQAVWQGQEGFLPARAQVAHQQAKFLLKTLPRRLRGQAVEPRAFTFSDYGSLVSVGHHRGVGSLMGVLSGKSWFVEGLLARLMYMSLHLMHHLAVLGGLRTATLALGRLLIKRGAPRVKLH